MLLPNLKANTTHRPTSDHIFPSRLKNGSRSWVCLWGGAGHEIRKRVSIEQCKVQRTVLVVEICELCMWRMYGCSIILLGHRWQHQKTLVALHTCLEPWSVPLINTEWAHHKLHWVNTQEANESPTCCYSRLALASISTDVALMGQLRAVILFTTNRCTQCQLLSW